MDYSLDEAVLEKSLANLERARPWSPRVVSKFEHFIRTSGDYALYYVNPLEFAHDKSLPEEEAIDLFLHACHAGLFQFHWQLMCPCCGDRVKNFSALKMLNARYFCSFCQVETTASLDDYIEVSFSIAPQIRRVSFHHPEGLSIADYCYKFRLHPGGRLPGGPRYVELMRQHQKGLDSIPPGGRVVYAFEAIAGSVFGHDFTHGASIGFPIRAGEGTKVGNASYVFAGGTFQPAPEPMAPGQIALTIENRGDKPLSFLLLGFPEDVPTDRLEFDPFLSGKRLLTSRTYHELFRSEIAPGTEGIGVRDITILFTDLKGSTAMYDRVGDLKAFSLVRQHFTHLDAPIGRHGGVLIKTIGDAIMAAFPQPEQALAAAIDMVRAIKSFSEPLPQHEKVQLKVGLHRGHSIVVTLNDHLDFFGQTVNIAARVQGLADADEIYLTQEVHRSPEVQAALKNFRVEPQTARLKGVQEEWNVFRVTP